jgi:cupin 2 domain-containing protein
MTTGNLFANVAHQLPNEQIVELLSAQNVRIERIVSTGHATALDEWYNQDRSEWVLLLAGSAGLIFEGESEPLLLEPGSYVHIAAHVRHRVAWTDPLIPTIWLAIPDFLFRCYSNPYLEWPSMRPRLSQVRGG